MRCSNWMRLSFLNLLRRCFFVRLHDTYSETDATQPIDRGKPLDESGCRPHSRPKSRNSHYSSWLLPRSFAINTAKVYHIMKLPWSCRVFSVRPSFSKCRIWSTLSLSRNTKHLGPSNPGPLRPRIRVTEVYKDTFYWMISFRFPLHVPPFASPPFC